MALYNALMLKQNMVILKHVKSAITVGKKDKDPDLDMVTAYPNMCQPCLNHYLKMTVTVQKAIASKLSSQESRTIRSTHFREFNAFIITVMNLIFTKNL